MRRPLIDRLMERIRLEGDCWRWVGYVHPTTGYGMFTVRGIGTRPAHRWMYEELVGPVPDGMELDHLCRNRWCVNPACLDPVTRHENIMRGDGPAATRRRAAMRTTCARGHEYTQENTATTGDGHRRCRACARENARRWGRANPQRVAEKNRRWREKQGNAA